MALAKAKEAPFKAELRSNSLGGGTRIRRMKQHYTNNGKVEVFESLGDAPYNDLVV